MFDWTTELPSTQLAIVFLGIAVCVLLGIETWLIIQLMRQNGRLLSRIEALEVRLPAALEAPNVVSTTFGQGFDVDVPAPNFELTTSDGKSRTLSSFLDSSKQVLLVFIDPQCSPCTHLLPRVAQWQQSYASHLEIVVVSSGAQQAHQSINIPLLNLLLQKHREVGELYGIGGTPSAILIDRNGLIASKIAAGAEAIERLVSLVVQSNSLSLQLPQLFPFASADDTASTIKHDLLEISTSTRTLNIGNLVPPIILQDRTGASISLQHFQDRNIILLFWNPQCSFCNQMLKQLKQWEHEFQKLTFVLISTRPIAETIAQGMTSLVFYDREHTIAQMFGARGTPMAVHVNQTGYIASTMVVGAQAIRELVETVQQRQMIVEV